MSLTLSPTRNFTVARSYVCFLTLVLAWALLATKFSLHAQEDFPPVALEQIRKIDAHRSTSAIHVDGKLSEKAWQEVEWSEPFVDLISGQPTRHDTQIKLLWDEQFLYVAYRVEEPFVTATFTERDSPIYQDNDVELFIAGKNAYYEFEINALGTIYEGLFVWQSDYQSSGLARLPELDRTRAQVKSQQFNGVGYKKHPRGLRWAFLEWDYPRAKSAVHVDGTLNNNMDRDRGWTVELAFPWEELRILDLEEPRSLPPKVGDVWRMDFSRFNQYKEAPRDGEDASRDSGGWAYSPHGVWDSHIPECFPYVRIVGSEKE